MKPQTFSVLFLFLLAAVPAILTAQDATLEVQLLSATSTSAPIDSVDDTVQTTEMEWLRAASPDTLVCQFRGQIDYEPGEIECGLIQVPENREVPNSRTIELNYVRIVATGETTKMKRWIYTTIR